MKVFSLRSFGIPARREFRITDETTIVANAAGEVSYDSDAGNI
jgi:hypothetical protein